MVAKQLLRLPSADEAVGRAGRCQTGRLAKVRTFRLATIVLKWRSTTSSQAGSVPRDATDYAFQALDMSSEVKHT